jgi:hypothetical protein
LGEWFAELLAIGERSRGLFAKPLPISEQDEERLRPQPSYRSPREQPRAALTFERWAFNPAVAVPVNLPSERAAFEMAVRGTGRNAGRSI